MVEFMFAPIIRNKTKWLIEHLGGKWVYRGRGGFYRSWECDDGRVIRYTACPLDEWDNPCGPAQCWLDTPGKQTQPFYWCEKIIITFPLPKKKVL